MLVRGRVQHGGAVIAGGCSVCGGTAGDGRQAAHALCIVRRDRGMVTPSLGDACPCCKGSGCHPRSAAGPINPNQDTVERWAPACQTCKGSGAVNIVDAMAVRLRDLEAAKKRHWFEGCRR